MKRKTKKIFIFVGCLIFIYFVVIPIVWVVISKDIDPIDDSDLDLKDIYIAKEENAYYDLMKIKDVIYYPTGEKNELILGEDENEWDEKIVEEILLKNEEAFQYFDDASQKPYFQDPEWSISKNISSHITVKGLNTFRNIAKLSDTKAKNLVKKGRNVEALEESFKIISIGNKIKSSQLPLIEFLVGSSIESIGLKSMTKIVKENNFTKKDLVSYSDKLSKLSSSNEHLKSVMKIEYILMKELLDLEELDRGEGMTKYSPIFRLINMTMPFNDTNKYYYKPNKTKLFFAEQARLDIKQVRDSACDNQYLENIKEDYSLDSTTFFEENFNGRYVFNLSSSSNLSRSWIRKECQADFLFSAIRLQLLLEAYKKQNGSYPEKVEYLVPEYVEKIEFYPFENDEINYLADKNVIFYKGEDVSNYEEDEDESFYMKKNLIISLD